MQWRSREHWTSCHIPQGRVELAQACCVFAAVEAKLRFPEWTLCSTHLEEELGHSLKGKEPPLGREGRAVWAYAQAVDCLLGTFQPRVSEGPCLTWGSCSDSSRAWRLQASCSGKPDPFSECDRKWLLLASEHVAKVAWTRYAHGSIFIVTGLRWGNAGTPFLFQAQLWRKHKISA